METDNAYLLNLLARSYSQEEAKQLAVALTLCLSHMLGNGSRDDADRIIANARKVLACTQSQSR